MGFYFIFEENDWGTFFFFLKKRGGVGVLGERAF